MLLLDTVDEVVAHFGTDRQQVEAALRSPAENGDVVGVLTGTKAHPIATWNCYIGVVKRARRALRDAGQGSWDNGTIFQHTDEVPRTKDMYFPVGEVLLVSIYGHPGVAEVTAVWSIDFQPIYVARVLWDNNAIGDTILDAAMIAY